jgi:predicted DNA-binding protein (UPF0251 family)
MGRPKDNRMVHEPPLFSEFKPMGVRSSELEQTALTLDEFEAFRLADDLGMPHAESAEEMGISRSTFTRLIERSRKKIADLIIHGKMLSIDGGTIHFRNNILRCQNCGQMFRIKIDNALVKCPGCGSEKIQNLAGGFGHGDCCHHHKKSGGHHAKQRQKRPTGTRTTDR